MIMEVHHLNHASKAAFDSRNNNVEENVWDCCLPCSDNDIKSGSRVDDMEVQSNSNVMKQSSSHIAKTLTELPPKERDNVFDDIHGVADIPKEQPEFIEEHLHLLDAELDKIKTKRAYFIAKSISKNYVSNSKFRLKFLRADQFDAKNAAARIVRHFETKLELFGKEKLTKNITLSDLSEEDIRYMKTGFFQLCHVKDRSGRSLMCSKQGLATAVPLETRLRVTWYIWNIAAEDEETQRKGAVLITFVYGQFKFSFESNYRIYKVIGAIPLRLSVTHMCHDYFASPAWNFLKSVMEKNHLCRSRIHHSSKFETVYTLMTFGIPRTIFSSDGEVDTSFAIDFIRRRLELENPTRITSSRALVPNKFDVLLGKGKRVLGSTGNLHCRELMEMYRDEYEQSSRLQKANITRHIFKQVKSQGGRFLKEGDFGWIEVDDEAAKKKISHHFRNLRR